MRETEDIQETVTNQRIVKVICNKCGDKSTEEDYDFERFQEFSISFGYGSRYDSEHWRFDLCDECLTELVRSFKVVPQGFGEDSYYATYPQIMFDEWKVTGVVDLEAGMTKEEIAERGGSIYVDDDEVFVEELMEENNFK